MTSQGIPAETSDRAQLAPSKLLSASALGAARDRLRQRGPLVFTNGCFDLLHVGHVRYLQQARSLGASLLVAVNGDASVHALKGEGRPINSQEDRAEILAALGCVDYVTIFPELRATNVLRAIRPDIYVKGGDYTVATLDAEEQAMLHETGVDVRILPLVPGRSTTAIIRQWLR